MSHPNADPALASAPSRGLVRTMVLDPGLLLGQILSAEDLARTVDELAGRTRDRLFKPLVTLATFLGQVSSDDHSCRAAVARLLAWRVARGLPAASLTTGGYCKARQRLPEALLPHLVRETADRIEGRAPEAWSFRGRRVLIADGSCVSMPDTPANQRDYPQHVGQRPGCGFPLARVVVLLSLATGCALDLAIGPAVGKRTGEHALLRGLHGRLRRGDILLADAYDRSFDAVVTLVGMGVDVVMRQVANRRTDFRRGMRLGRDDHLVEWHRHRNRPEWMSREAFAALPRVLPMRELRVRVEEPGFRTRAFVVVTSLTDADAYRRGELGSLYRRRWDAELDIRSIKQTMRMDVLRCKTPAMVRKEVFAHLLAYNLVRAVMAEAACRHGVEPRRLSFQGARQVLEAFRSELARAGPGRAEALRDEVLRAIAGERVGDRPGRYEPRARKRRPKMYIPLTVPRREARRRLARAG